ncbi:hypothetical protein [Leuconostoc mesenteroides]|uniref:hypothetical protein n=1 Tax=Leuconostoc mesenteroides TaxID=1245 RepID=UPI00077871A4|nr:hypothetical protein [Leuconostoc mesenteroides]
MKKEVNITVGIIAAVGIAFSAVSLNTSSKNVQQVSSHSEKKSDFSIDSSKSVTTTNNTQLTNAADASSYDPNKTMKGVEVTQTMIDNTRSELIAAGLPADQWGPSDIKKIITESSRQNVSVVDYAKDNFHE